MLESRGSWDTHWAGGHVDADNHSLGVSHRIPLPIEDWGITHRGHQARRGGPMYWKQLCPNSFTMSNHVPEVTTSWAPCTLACHSCVPPSTLVQTRNLRRLVLKTSHAAVSRVWTLGVIIRIHYRNECYRTNLYRKGIYWKDLKALVHLVQK